MLRDFENLRSKKKPIDPEKQFELVETQLKELVQEVLKANPEISSATLAEKIMETWRKRPEGSDIINLLEVKNCLQVTIGFRGKEKKISIEL